MRFIDRSLRIGQVGSARTARLEPTEWDPRLIWVGFVTRMGKRCHKRLTCVTEWGIVPHEETPGVPRWHEKDRNWCVSR
jgi:hypothetical protein